MKNFEQNLLALNAKFDQFETLTNIVGDPEKLNKLEQLLENVELDDLIDAVKLYRENLLHFQENTSMSQSASGIGMSQGMTFGKNKSWQNVN